MTHFEPIIIYNKILLLKGHVAHVWLLHMVVVATDVATLHSIAVLLNVYPALQVEQ